MTLKDAIRDYVNRHDHVSFAELKNHLGGYDTDGTHALALGTTNVLLWADCSREFISAVVELMDTGDIHPQACNPLVYLCDGMSLNLPIVRRRPPAGGFRDEHWLPVTLRPGKARSV